MSIRAQNNEEIEKRGAFQAQYGEFILYKCSNCGNFVLYDKEHLQIYLDAEDLSNHKLYNIKDSENTGDHDALCPSCNAVNPFDEAPDEDYIQVSVSPWAFVLHES